MGRHDDFYRGFAAAIGTLAREHDQPSMAADIMASNGVTLRMLREAGAEDFDLDYITKEALLKERRARGPRKGKR